MRPKTKESNQPLPTLNDCSEIVLVSAVIAKLTPNGDRPVRIGSSEVTKALQTLRKHAAAARRDKTKSLVAFELKISAQRKISVQLATAGLDALSHFGAGLLAPLIAKACACVNGQDFEKKAKALVDIEVGPLPPGKSMKLTVAGKMIKLG